MTKCRAGFATADGCDKDSQLLNTESRVTSIYMHDAMNKNIMVIQSIQHSVSLLK